MYCVHYMQSVTFRSHCRAVRFVHTYSCMTTRLNWNLHINIVMEKCIIYTPFFYYNWQFSNISISIWEINLVVMWTWNHCVLHFFCTDPHYVQTKRYVVINHSFLLFPFLSLAHKTEVPVKKDSFVLMPVVQAHESETATQERISIFPEKALCICILLSVIFYW